MIQVFQIEKIDSDDDDIKEYERRVDFYHSRKIVKTGKQNNALEVKNGNFFN